jgi:hypothetical protein
VLVLAPTPPDLKMKFLQVCSIFIVFSQVLAESEYANYQTNYDHYNQAETGYNSDLTSAYNYVSEKQDIDMDVILPIAVFGGLGLGALAYIDTLNRQNNLCNKLREVTNVARANAASGTTTAALVGETGETALTNALATAANTVINGNRDFINALALIDNLDC